MAEEGNIWAQCDSSPHSRIPSPAALWLVVTTEASAQASLVSQVVGCRMLWMRFEFLSPAAYVLGRVSEPRIETAGTGGRLKKSCRDWGQSVGSLQNTMLSPHTSLYTRGEITQMCMVYVGLPI